MNIIDSCISALRCMTENDYGLCSGLKSGANTLTSWSASLVSGVSYIQNYLSDTQASLLSQTGHLGTVKLFEREVNLATAGLLSQTTIMTAVTATTPFILPFLGTLCSIIMRNREQHNQSYTVASRYSNRVQTKNTKKLLNAISDSFNIAERMNNQKTTWSECCNYLLTALHPVAILPQICAATSTTAPIAGILPAAVPVFLGLFVGGMACRFAANKIDRWHEKRTAQIMQSNAEVFKEHVHRAMYRSVRTGNSVSTRKLPEKRNSQKKADTHLSAILPKHCSPPTKASAPVTLQPPQQKRQQNSNHNVRC